MLYLGSFWLIHGRTFREAGATSLHPSVYRLLIIDCVRVSEQYVVELSGLPYFWRNLVKPCSFPIFNFLRTESSSSWLNGPSLMSNCLLIILVNGACVTFVGFPCRFFKCCFHSFIHSCWFVAFNFAVIVLFLLLTSFIVCQAILDCLSSTESLIFSIRFCIYYVCSFKYSC